ncbi:MAG: succinate--CoA ligase subunit beta, partial [Verrucomicrobiae bacterium]|nr:succinate--CoA ligase subunit beta [Verrucomicrobiae bacterium]
MHEYQAKQLLRNRGIAVPPGDVAGNPSEARVIAENLRVAGFKGFFVKAQIHAGGRGFGFFPGSSLKSGVVHCETPAEVEHVASQMLGNNLVTSQTSAGGNKVSKVLVEAAIPCPHECYAAVMLDRNRECPVLLASGCGGQTVERDISASPRELIKEWVDPVIGACQYQARRIALALGFNGELLHPCATFLLNLSLIH